MNMSRCEQMGTDERQALGRAQQLEEEQKRTQGESAQLQAGCACASMQVNAIPVRVSNASTHKPASNLFAEFT